MTATASDGAVPPHNSPADQPTEFQDAMLVAQLRAGNVEAFRKLFFDVHAPLCAFVERIVGDDARAQELVQDLFLELWQRRESLSLSGSVRAYLYATARNRALNVRRRDQVERAWEDDESLDDVRALHEPPARADQLLEQAERHEALTSAMNGLPERCRTAMQLRWQEGLSYAEVAQVLGIGVKAVEKQLARGIRLLRDALGNPSNE
ncbi:MAG: RNA polymerase sigma-70 factor [Gemmatimonadaceae bacterium]|nr:RNA polymerase sigma-70 factor [Gemmatimonadaceae bacterium]